MSEKLNKKRKERPQDRKRGFVEGEGPRKEARRHRDELKRQVESETDIFKIDGKLTPEQEGVATTKDKGELDKIDSNADEAAAETKEKLERAAGEIPANYFEGADSIEEILNRIGTIEKKGLNMPADSLYNPDTLQENLNRFYDHYKNENAIPEKERPNRKKALLELLQGAGMPSIGGLHEAIARAVMGTDKPDNDGKEQPNIVKVTEVFFTDCHTLEAVDAKFSTLNSPNVIDQTGKSHDFLQLYQNYSDGKANLVSFLNKEGTRLFNFATEVIEQELDGQLSKNLPDLGGLRKALVEAYAQDLKQNKEKYTEAAKIETKPPVADSIMSQEEIDALLRYETGKSKVKKQPDRMEAGDKLKQLPDDYFASAAVFTDFENLLNIPGVEIITDGKGAEYQINTVYPSARRVMGGLTNFLRNNRNLLLPKSREQLEREISERPQLHNYPNIGGIRDAIIRVAANEFEKTKNPAPEKKPDPAKVSPEPEPFDPEKAKARIKEIEKRMRNIDAMSSPEEFSKAQAEYEALEIEKNELTEKLNAPTVETPPTGKPVEVPKGSFDDREAWQMEEFTKFFESLTLEDFKEAEFLKIRFVGMFTDELVNKLGYKLDQKQYLANRYFESFLQKAEEYFQLASLDQERNKSWRRTKDEVKKGLLSALGGALYTGASKAAWTAVKIGTDVAFPVKVLMGGVTGSVVSAIYFGSAKLKEKLSGTNLKKLANKIEKGGKDNDVIKMISERLQDDLGVLMEYDVKREDQVFDYLEQLKNLSEEDLSEVFSGDFKSKAQGIKELINLTGNARTTEKGAHQDALIQQRQQLIAELIGNGSLNEYITFQINEQLKGMDLDKMEESEKVRLIKFAQLQAESEFNALLGDVVAQEKYAEVDQKGKSAYEKSYLAKLLSKKNPENIGQALLKGFVSGSVAGMFYTNAYAGGIYAGLQRMQGTLRQELMKRGEKVVKTPAEMIRDMDSYKEETGSEEQVKRLITEARARIKLPDIKEVDRAKIERSISNLQRRWFEIVSISGVGEETNLEIKELAQGIVDSRGREIEQAADLAELAKKNRSLFGLIRQFRGLGGKDKMAVLGKAGLEGVKAGISGAIGAGLVNMVDAAFHGQAINVNQFVGDIVKRTTLGAVDLGDQGQHGNGFSKDNPDQTIGAAGADSVTTHIHEILKGVGITDSTVLGKLDSIYHDNPQALDQANQVLERANLPAEQRAAIISQSETPQDLQNHVADARFQTLHPSVEHAGFHNEVVDGKINVSLEMGKDGAPRHLEQVFDRLAVDGSKLGSEFTNLEASRVLNVAANLRELSEGHSVAGITTEEFQKHASIENGKLVINDYEAFRTDVIDKLVIHSNEIITEANLPNTGAVASVDNISKATWQDMLKPAGISVEGIHFDQQMIDQAENRLFGAELKNSGIADLAQNIHFKNEDSGTFNISDHAVIVDHGRVVAIDGKNLDQPYVLNQKGGERLKEEIGSLNAAKQAQVEQQIKNAGAVHAGGSKYSGLSGEPRDNEDKGAVISHHDENIGADGLKSFHHLESDIANIIKMPNHGQATLNLTLHQINTPEGENLLKEALKADGGSKGKANNIQKEVEKIIQTTWLDQKQTLGEFLMHHSENIDIKSAAAALHPETPVGHDNKSHEASLSAGTISHEAQIREGDIAIMNRGHQEVFRLNDETGRYECVNHPETYPKGLAADEFEKLYEQPGTKIIGAEHRAAAISSDQSGKETAVVPDKHEDRINNEVISHNNERYAKVNVVSLPGADIQESYDAREILGDHHFNQNGGLMISGKEITFPGAISIVIDTNLDGNLTVMDMSGDHTVHSAVITPQGEVLKNQGINVTDANVTNKDPNPAPEIPEQKQAAKVNPAANVNPGIMHRDISDAIRTELKVEGLDGVEVEQSRDAQLFLEQHKFGFIDGKLNLNGQNVAFDTSTKSIDMDVNPNGDLVVTVVDKDNARHIARISPQGELYPAKSVNVETPVHAADEISRDLPVPSAEILQMTGKNIAQSVGVPGEVTPEMIAQLDAKTLTNIESIIKGTLEELPKNTELSQTELENAQTGLKYFSSLIEKRLHGHEESQ